MLLELQFVRQWLCRLPWRIERSTLPVPAFRAEHVSSLDVTLGADTLLSLTVTLAVLSGHVKITTAAAVMVGTASITAARSYVRYQHVQVR
ncbi:hypothetical protein AF335_05540 [Streptomyces eurocidicus]|uniref:Uncharacterized protein n=1 Tax=Streptomyces eurocidicus TaxID=66423 RepID=A0A2N8NZD9_STREU|nr:hypothetical protein [Streptomyces eurocidicus]MBB5120829.1 hypothetical protein [Streptomyces eurocidicus]MBF6054470.1 hypothetical protein [Streptomyces eurocidicus]PNE34129.1 hypothetical protein AF335_05540 [Streptomyces eurocidicus]